MSSRAGGTAISWVRRLPALLGVALLVGAIYVVQREFRHLRLADIGRALEAIPLHALVFSLGWTVLSYFILTFYDRLGTIYAGHKVSYGRVAFASFCACEPNTAPTVPETILKLHLQDCRKSSQNTLTLG